MGLITQVTEVYLHVTLVDHTLEVWDKECLGELV